MRFIKQLFTWWSGQTLGTRLFTLLRGKLIGEDEYGNRYYENGDGSRRWVIYHDYSEASQVGAQWHGWLHHSFDNRPGREPLERQDWERPHQENLTGTEGAYSPATSLYADIDGPGGQGAGGSRYAGDAGYSAWTPDHSAKNSPSRAGK